MYQNFENGIPGGPFCVYPWTVATRRLRRLGLHELMNLYSDIYPFLIGSVYKRHGV